MDTQAVLEDCRLVGNATVGAFLGKGGHAALLCCHFAGNRSTGVEVAGRGSRAGFDRCELSGNGCVDLYVHSAARVQLVSSSIIARDAAAVLCGSVKQVGLAGGLIEHCSSCKLSGRVISRHGGRVRAVEALDSDDSGHRAMLMAAA